MDLNVRQTGIGDRAMGTGKGRGTVLGRMRAKGKSNRGAPTSFEPPDQERSPFMANMPAPARAAQVSDISGQWPVQLIATDMVEFAEMLHRRLQSVSGRSGGKAPAAAQLHETFRELEDGLIILLARNGIERTDPIGSLFDQRCHQKVGERRLSGCTPGTVVQTLSSAWTLNDQLLRPAVVIVAASPGEGASSSTAYVMNTSASFGSGAASAEAAW